ncbi:MAG TPA: hypothetical protein VH914_03240 [Acidimicrobiia bacterium]|jgi:hypothetical protein|nr:hypothetical protein [Acidimicrobiia bacterium]
MSTCSSCIESLDDMEWEAASTFLVGEWALGVRSSTAELDADLRRILAAHVIDLDAPANFSALVSRGDDDEQVHGFHFLYRASDTLVRTRTPRRIVRTLLHHLSDFAEPAATTTLPRLAAVGLVANGRAVIAPERIRAELPNVESRLNDAGVAIVDVPVLHLDPDDACLVVPEPALTIDRDALADFERRHPPAPRELEPVAPGRYPLAAWAFTTEEHAAGPLGVAPAVAAGAQEVVNAAAVGAQAVLDGVAAVFSRVPAFGISWANPAALGRRLVELSESR